MNEVMNESNGYNVTCGHRNIPAPYSVQLANGFSRMHINRATTR